MGGLLRAEEGANRAVSLARPLDLRHVTAVELDVLRGGQYVLDVAGKANRHHAVALAPDEEGFSF